MSVIRYIRSYLTLKKHEFLFTDSVSGKGVYSFRDCYGDDWMKDGRWKFFRVKRKSRVAMEGGVMDRMCELLVERAILQAENAKLKADLATLVKEIRKQDHAYLMTVVDRMGRLSGSGRSEL